MGNDSKYHSMSDHDLLIVVATNQDNLQSQAERQNGTLVSLQERHNELPCGANTERINDLEDNQSSKTSRNTLIKVALISAGVTTLAAFLSGVFV